MGRYCGAPAGGMQRWEVVPTDRLRDRAIVVTPGRSVKGPRTARCENMTLGNDCYPRSWNIENVTHCDTLKCDHSGDLCLLVPLPGDSDIYSGPVIKSAGEDTTAGILTI